MPVARKKRKRRKRVRTFSQLEFILHPQRTPDGPKPVAHKSVGKRTSLGVCTFWAALFERNERVPQEKRMTDAELIRQVAIEFPDRPSTRKLVQGKQTVNYHRQLYNSGRYTRGIVPKHQSRRYDEQGNVTNRRGR
jgi:hypothetical protein